MHNLHQQQLLGCTHKWPVSSGRCCMRTHCRFSSCCLRRCHHGNVDEAAMTRVPVCVTSNLVKHAEFSWSRVRQSQGTHILLKGRQHLENQVRAVDKNYFKRQTAWSQSNTKCSCVFSHSPRHPINFPHISSSCLLLYHSYPPYVAHLPSSLKPLCCFVVSMLSIVNRMRTVVFAVRDFLLLLLEPILNSVHEKKIGPAEENSHTTYHAGSM